MEFYATLGAACQKRETLEQMFRAGMTGIRLNLAHTSLGQCRPLLESRFFPAARAAGVKSVSMLPQKQLLPLTGYVHGGCSPVGMSKSFPTYFAEEVILVDTMICSAGKVGYQVEVAPDDLIALVGGQVADLTQQ